MGNVWSRRVLGFLLFFIGAGALASLSRAPWTAPGATDAVVRLSWRATSQWTEECRTLTEGERRRLPAHMQQERLCEGRVAPYRLQVRIDGTTVANDTVQAAGARGDRPIYVLREFAVEPGEREVWVEFESLGALAPETGRGAEERPGSVFPASLVLRSRVRAVPGRAVLVTYDADARSLIVRTAGA